MDRKMGAVLAVAIIGLLVGVAGIVMANDAKSSNQDTQAQLDAAVARESKRVDATAAAAKAGIRKSEAGIRKSEKSDQASVASAEEADKKTAQQDSDQIATFQSTLDDLKSQIADLQAAEKSSTQKLNARIDALSSRVGG